jgi:hypothetical protein
VVSVRVGDDGPIHRFPGIDIKIADLAIESAIREGEKGHAGK